jgi:hypothetical protein
MNNQEIIDNAPEGAEFTSSMGYLWNDNEDWFIYGATTEEWNHLFFHEYSFSDWKIRSLADIKRIVELEKENTKLKKIVDNHSGGFVACMTGNQFTANNLKQQAKALNEYAYSNKPLTKRGLNLKSIVLIDQAKALKEPKT